MYGPMPLFDTAPWSVWDQCCIIAVYVVLLVSVRKMILEPYFGAEKEFLFVQSRKILTGLLCIHNCYNYLSVDGTGLVVFPIWAEVAMVIENFVFLRERLMTSPSKWGHDITMLVCQVVCFTGAYRNGSDKTHIRQWQHFYVTIFYSCWVVESTFLYLNHKSQRGQIDKRFMRAMYGLTVLCCLHNIFFFFGQVWFVFYDSTISSICNLSFASQWIIWTRSIYSRGTR